MSETDDTERVYIRRVFYSAGSSGKRFHTDPDCQYVTDDHRLKPRTYAEQRGGKLCTACDPETENHRSQRGRQKKSLRQLIAAEEVSVDD